jgi:hypothetical protein
LGKTPGPGVNSLSVLRPLRKYSQSELLSPYHVAIGLSFHANRLDLEPGMGVITIRPIKAAVIAFEVDDVGYVGKGEGLGVKAEGFHQRSSLGCGAGWG